jgi:hypothetical protein
VSSEEFVKLYLNKHAVYKKLQELETYLDNIENMTASWLTKRLLNNDCKIFLYLNNVLFKLIFNNF